jgi:hypothetical protein
VHSRRRRKALVGAAVALPAEGGFAALRQRSTAEGECVQTAKLPCGGVAVRNSRHPDGPALLFSDAEFRTFLEGVKDGDFDDVLGCRG